MKTIRGLAALTALVALVAGVPALLIATVGNPWPAGGLAEVELGSDQAALGLLAGLGWVFWAQMVACIAAEVPAVLAGLPAMRVPLTIGAQQHLARVLVHSVVAIGIGSAALAPAATPDDTAHIAPTAAGTAPWAETAAGPSGWPAPSARHHPHGRLGAADDPDPGGYGPSGSGPTHPGDGHVVGVGGTATGHGSRDQISAGVSGSEPAVSVSRGDTLWGLAERHLGAGERWREIADINRGRQMSDGARFGSGHDIRPGWTLLLPGDARGLPASARQQTTHVEVQPGDTLSGIAADHLGDPGAWPSLYAANRALVGADPDLILPGQVLTLLGHQAKHHPTSPETTSPDPTNPETAPPADLGPTPGDLDPGQEAPKDRVGEDRDRSGQPGPPQPSGAEQTPAPPRVTPLDRASTPRTGTDASDDSAAGPDAGTGMDSAQTEETRQEKVVTALRALLATAVCLAGGALGLLVLNRRRQFRERRSGRMVAATPDGLAAVERAVREAGPRAMETTTFLDLALRDLAAAMRAHQRPMPDLGAATVDQHQFRLIFTVPALADPPDGWQDPTGEGLTWTLPRDSVLDAELLEQPPPYPALVSVGIDDQGRTWLLDLEAVGHCVITSEIDAADFGRGDIGGASEDIGAAVVRYLVAELALNPWSEGVEVLLAGPAAETVGLAPARVRVVEPQEAAHRAGLMAHDTEEVRAALGQGLLGLRRDAVAVDSTGPLVMAAPHEAGAAVPQPGPGRVRSRLVVLTQGTAEQPMIRLTGPDTAVLPEWGVQVQPFTLPSEQAQAMAALMVATGRVTDEPMPPADTESALGAYANRDGALRQSLTEPREGQVADPTSLLPEPDAAYLKAAATTPEDLAALAPSVPTRVRAEVEALDPNLDEDIAAWRDPHSPRPKVQVLGPLTIQAPAGDPDKVASVASTIELVVYLACHQRGVTPERTAEALGWSLRTVHNRARDARRLLGRGPDGHEWLPEATKSPIARQRGVALYQLHPDVLVSADLFRRLRLRAQARGAEGHHDLVAALALVDGIPFDQQRRGGYGWLADEEPLDHYLCHGVVDVSHLVADQALVTGDTRLARWACEVAITASPYEDGPRLDLAAVTTAEEGSPDDVVRDQVLNRVEADPTTRTEQILDQRRWMTG